ncbi:DUF1295-domain-containing protein [Thozetella sp. PMI_491]|nr:DUF1295-domain-containing protein [Thozetella sp. PMI_491]
MAIPTLKTLEDCASYNLTVEPYLPQLYELPQKLVDVISNRGSLLDLYVNTNPLIFGFAVSIFLGAVFLVAAEVNRNYSQVDRFWSLLPTLYIAHFAVWARLAGVHHYRVDGALFFSTAWSIRLTFNYWRKGGYDIGVEDYRWEIIRAKIPKWLFHIFNWTFISFIQSMLLFALAAPVYIILLVNQVEPNFGWEDLSYVVLELAFVGIEIVADQQQWDFQQAKAQYQKTAKVLKGFKQVDLDRGFITSGLWAFSRHPNFAAEQSIWLFLYQWSCYATLNLYSWAGVGPSFLVLLFQGSTWLTEAITAGKYPEYKDYQKAVGMFVPTTTEDYKTPVREPKIIRTSELDKKYNKKTS